MIIASFQQNYHIELNKEWLENNTALRFKALLGNLNKDSAIGQYFQAEALKKDKNYQKLTGQKKPDKQYNLQNKDDIDSFHNFAKMFAKQ